MVLIIGSVPAPGLPDDFLVRMAPDVGETLLENIGWGLGVYISGLLGFYVMVIGRQIVADRATEYRTRRQLGLIAEVLAGSLVPIVLLILTACIRNPREAGVLMIVVPAAFLIMFLAAKLGSFGVVEDEIRRTNARATRKWAAERLRMVSVRSRKPIVVVLSANALCGMLAGVLVGYAAGGRNVVLVGFGMIYFVGAFFLAWGGDDGHSSRVTAKARFNRAAAWVIPVCFYVGAVAIAILFAFKAELWVGLGFAATIATMIILTSVSAPPSSRVLVNWTLRGSAERGAAIWFARRYRDAVRTIMELAPKR